MLLLLTLNMWMFAGNRSLCLLSHTLTIGLKYSRMEQVRQPEKTAIKKLKWYGLAQQTIYTISFQFFFKAVFHKFYLLHSRILCLKCISNFIQTFLIFYSVFWIDLRALSFGVDQSPYYLVSKVIFGKNFSSFFIANFKMFFPIY